MELTVIQPKDLQHLTELEQEIVGYRSQFADLKIEDENDKEGYERVRVAIGVLRPKRTGLEKERAGIVKPYNDAIKSINARYKDVISTIEEIEEPLQTEKARIDDIKEQKRLEKEREEAAKINKRINDLISAGAIFDGEYYSVGSQEFEVTETSVGVVDIQTMSDELFAQFLQTVMDKTAVIKSRNEEKIRKAEEERIRQQEEEIERKRKLDEQEAEIRQQRERMEEQSRKLKEQEHRLAEQQREQDRKARESLMMSRTAELNAVGLSLSNDGSVFTFEKTPVITSALVQEADPAAWEEVIDESKRKVADLKEKAARFIAEQEEEDRKRKQQEEEARLAEMGDADRMADYCTRLLQVAVPSFKLKKFTTTLATITNVIRDNQESALKATKKR